MNEQEIEHYKKLVDCLCMANFGINKNMNPDNDSTLQYYKIIAESKEFIFQHNLKTLKNMGYYYL